MTTAGDGLSNCISYVYFKYKDTCTCIYIYIYMYVSKSLVNSAIEQCRSSDMVLLEKVDDIMVNHVITFIFIYLFIYLFIFFFGYIIIN
jgi:hypothetical protein